MSVTVSEAGSLDPASTILLAGGLVVIKVGMWWDGERSYRPCPKKLQSKQCKDTENRRGNCYLHPSTAVSSTEGLGY